ncbi:MAG TPA: flagellar hook-associated protein FlgK [Glaciihabitans sp.]|jgi:flagellar hook-associated protein 1 FlgK|nr:flagellar hook-associated protein FlgK [Glaciihabitans sp.]
MSTFSGISAASSALAAARASIDVAGQNIANATTEGYTRQRLTLAAVSSPERIGNLFSPQTSAGQGVAVTGITRIANEMLDARVRSAVSATGYSFVRASAFSAVETTFNEPGDSGLSAGLTDFWSAWQDLSNNAGGEAASAVVIEQATLIASQLAAGYTAVSGQWDALRSDASVITSDLNSSAQQVAELNGLIRTAASIGQSPNALLDQRAVLTTAIAEMSGATITQRPDGTVDVLLGGNPLVSGTTAHEVVVGGATSIEGGGVHLEWSSRPGAIALDGGELAGTLAMLAPAAGGANSTLSSIAANYNTIALALADQVNTIHQQGQTTSGVTGLSFFGLAQGVPAALGLSVIPTNASGIAAGGAAGGSLDGSIADRISQISKDSGSPDTLWASLVTTVAVQTKTELQHFALAELASTNATAAQLANSSVDVDEENVNLLTSQTAYQAAARVLTAMDEMLDTLINRTGLVGR